MLVLLQPSKEQTYLPARPQAADPTQELLEEFNRNGIDYLDLAPVFRQRAAAGERLFFEADGHPNQAGMH